MAQGVGPEFKPQKHQKQKDRKKDWEERRKGRKEKEVRRRNFIA
jgi:hypothetical protein